MLGLTVHHLILAPFFTPPSKGRVARVRRWIRRRSGSNGRRGRWPREVAIVIFQPSPDLQGYGTDLLVCLLRRKPQKQPWGKGLFFALNQPWHQLDPNHITSLQSGAGTHSHVGCATRSSPAAAACRVPCRACQMRSKHRHAALSLIHI